MFSIYSDAEYLAAYKQKQKIWWVFVGITLVYLACCVAMVIYHSSMPYADPRLAIPKWITYILTALYIGFIYPYMAIKFSRARRYFILLSNISAGLKKDETNYFYCFDEKTLQSDNISVEACVFETWDKKKSEWRERETYLDVERERPPFESGDLVRYMTQSNFVVEYEILQKKVLEFEEIEDGEEQNLEEMEEIEQTEDTNE